MTTTFIWLRRALSILYIVQVGTNTKRSSGIILAAIIIATIVSSSGCVYFDNLLQPDPTAVPIVVTITPAPKPTVTPAPTVVVPQKSADVRIVPVGENGIVSGSFGFVKDTDQQKENFSVVLANDGLTDAKNVILILTETDAHGGNMVIQQQFKIGDMRSGEREEYQIVTDEHPLASSVLIQVTLMWGTDGEFSNPVTFINTAKSIWM